MANEFDAEEITKVDEIAALPMEEMREADIEEQKNERA